ncbi:FtsW/RodA/SpoVE family cell cycle protein [Cohnella luojiensis]|uniref:FtsW/RodA/SpoVE family cell cycle protein n=1 Tax=Cohnella luojiensis TaxID=652876 RepID=A0A4Y8LY09_9BACL|nr:FtsW/RodA/SpoVE family cell cycle protein [Cohnella luojiensis]TFE26320.1 FtsW/RodA/SpoVE family cell cycle protein [Cohnella luojiensis]
MKQQQNHSRVEQFLEEVCERVRAKELHEEIKEELRAHLDELIEGNLSQGMSEEEAVKQAVVCMGEPDLIGKGLDKVHRPRTDWGMLAIIGLLSVIGILAMYSVQMSEAELTRMLNFFQNKIILTGIGLVFMTLLWALDYRKLKKYSESLFVFGIGILVLAPFIAEKINGATAWIMIGQTGLHIPTIAIMAMSIGLAGIKPAKEWGWKESIVQLVCRGVIPFVLLMKMNSLAFAAVYTAIFVAFLWITRRNVAQIMTFGAGFTGFIYFIVVGSDYYNYYVTMRLRNFLVPWNDPNGEGFMLQQARNAIHSGGWWGQGIGTPNRTIPYVQSEGMLPYFIYCFGWLAGIAVVMLILCFIGKAIETTYRTKDEFGKRLSFIIGMLLIVQFVWTVLMTFGYAPFVGLTIPFLSYGGTGQVLQFATIGLLLSIYRRRDTIPTSWMPNTINQIK